MSELHLNNPSNVYMQLIIQLKPLKTALEGKEFQHCFEKYNNPNTRKSLAILQNMTIHNIRNYNGMRDSWVILNKHFHILSPILLNAA